MSRSGPCRRAIRCLTALLALAIGWVSAPAEAQDPQAATARISAAEGRWRAGDFEAAEADLRSILEGRQGGVGDAAERVAARSALAGLLWRQGRDTEAAALLLANIEEEVESAATAEANLTLARVLAASDWQAAAEFFQAAADSATGPRVRAPALRGQDLLRRTRLRPAQGSAAWTGCRDLTAVLGADRPSGVAADATGRILLADRLGLTVASFAGEVQDRRALADLSKPFWGPDGQAYAVTAEGVQTVPGGLQSFTDPAAARPRSMQNPLAAERDVTGRWLILSRRGQAALFDSAGQQGRELDSGPGSQTTDVSRDGRGRIHILDGKSDQVLRLDPGSARPVTVLAGNWKRPESLAVDDHGNLLVLDRAERRIHLYDPAGVTLASVGPELPGGCELKTPVDIAIDGHGRLFVAQSRPDSLLVLE